MAAGILALLCIVLLFTASTVNRPYLSNVDTNRFWKVCQIWQERGFFASFGLWLEYVDPAFYRRSGAAAVYAYANSDTGFLVPIYAAEQLLTALRGKPSAFLFQLYSQLVILVGAFFIALLAMDAALRRGHDIVFAGTVAVAAGIVFQNVMPNLHRASEIHHSTVFLTLMLAALYVRDRWFDRVHGPDIRQCMPVAALIFAMAISDHIVNAAFFSLAVGLLAVYGIGLRVSRARWLIVYAVPVVAGEALFQVQLWLGKKVLGISSVGSPLLFRMGLGKTGFAHGQILTFLRPPWSWWGLASAAAISLIALLVACVDENDDRNRRDLDQVLIPILIWICLAATFSELIAIHPYIYDLFLIVPSILLVFVHAPLLLARYYRHPGIIALGVLMGAFWYVWLSLTTYATVSSKLPFG